jgi:hypothetical protein
MYDDEEIKKTIAECIETTDISTTQFTNKGLVNLEQKIGGIIDKKRYDEREAAAQAKQAKQAEEAAEAKAAAVSKLDSSKNSDTSSELASGSDLSSELASGSDTSSGAKETISSLSTITPPKNIIKITENKLTKIISSEFVPTKGDDSDNSRTKIIFFEISNDFCQEINKLYIDSTKTKLGSKKFSNEELKKLIYRIILSNNFIYKNDDLYFILCYLLTIINTCGCFKCLQENINCTISRSDKTNDNNIETIKLAYKLKKIYQILCIDEDGTINKFDEETFKLYMTYFISLMADDGFEPISDEGITNTIKLILFNGDKLYSLDNYIMLQMIRNAVQSMRAINFN